MPLLTLYYTALLASILSHYALPKLVLQETGPPSKLCSCLELIARRHFEETSTTSLLIAQEYMNETFVHIKKKTRASEGEIMVSQHFQRHFPTLLMGYSVVDSRMENICNGPPLRRKVDLFILIGTVEKIAKFMDSICLHRLVGGTSSSFVVCLDRNGTKGNKTDEVQTALDVLWAHDQQNAIVLAEDSDGEMNIYSWLPLRKLSPATVVDKCNGERFRYNADLFPDKVPHDFEGWVMKTAVSTSEPNICPRIGGGFMGFEVDLAVAITSALNIKLDLIPTSDLRISSSNASRGNLDDTAGPMLIGLLGLEARKVDMSLGGYRGSVARGYRFGYTLPYFIDRIAIFATKELILANFMNSYRSGIILPMMVVVFLVSLTINTLAYDNSHICRRTRDFGRSFFQIWSTMTELGTDLSQLSRKQLFLWTVFAFFAINLNASRRGFITSALTQHPYTDKVKSVQDLVESDYRIAIRAPNIPIGTIFNEEQLERVKTQVIMCANPILNCLGTLISFPHHGLVGIQGQIQFADVILTKRAYRALGRPVATYPNVIYTRKNYLLTDKFNLLILRSAQAGLIEYWYSKTLRNYQQCNFSRPDWVLLRNSEANVSVMPEDFTGEAKALSLEHVLNCFELLVGGLSLAAIAFMLECLSVIYMCRSLRQCVSKMSKRLASSVRLTFMRTAFIK